MKSTDTFLTLTEAAAAMGVSYPHLQTLCRTGVVQRTRRGPGAVWITQAEVDKYNDAKAKQTVAA